IVAETIGQSVRLRTDELNLQLLAPLVSLFTDDAMCEGTVTCDVAAQLSGSHLLDGIIARGQLTGSGIRIRMADWADGEWIRVDHLKAGGAAAVARDGFLLDDVEVTSDLINLRGQGELRGNNNSGSASSRSSTSSESGSAPVGSAQRPLVMMQGDIDAAAITRMLPGTLRLQPGVRVQQARILFGIRGQHDLDSQTDQWTGFVSGDQITAIRDNQQVAWNSPIRLDAAGHIRNGIAVLQTGRLSGGFGLVNLKPHEKGWLVDGKVQPRILWRDLQQLVEIPPPGVAGEVDFQTQVELNGSVLRLADLSVRSTELTAESRQLELDPTQPLTSMLNGAVTLRATGASVKTLASPVMDAWWLSDQTQVAVRVSGSPESHLQLQASVTPSQMSPRHTQSPGMRPVSRSTTPMGEFDTSGLTIDEADVNLAVERNATGEWLVRDGQIRLPGLQTTIQGTATPVDGITQVNLTAGVRYDLDTLSGRILGPQSPIRLGGIGEDTFLITGSMAGTVPNSGGEPLRISGKVAWRNGTLYGMPVGPGSVTAQFDQGIVRTEPVQFSLGGGQAHVMARYDVQNEVLELASGSRVEGIELTEQFCEEWLGYVSPLMAESAQVNGSISARVERMLWDLNRTNACQVSGTLSIHSAEATPGSSLLQVLQAIDTFRRLENADRSTVVRSLIMPPQNIPVEVRDGYVTHQGLQIQLAGYQAESSGAVGISNRTLQVNLTVPLEKNAANAGGRTVQIPLRGTIDSPQPDLSTLVRDLGAGRIEQEINGRVNRELNKLFQKF
ncbi:MAG: hypothetical protein KDA96_13515, partial [Planctomycetaceae bacterium]|nr:hypothetical protein [Planctomycetaceae bacterium]